MFAPLAVPGAGPRIAERGQALEWVDGYAVADSCADALRLEMDSGAVRMVAE